MAKKLKKALKGLAKVALPAAAIAALMKGKQGRASTNADAIKAMTSNAAMRNSMLNKPFGGMLTEEDYNSPMFLNAMKKGGRVKKTKGFSKTKKKQANRMRKK